MTPGVAGVEVVEADPQQDVGGRRPAEGRRDASRRGASARRHPSSAVLVRAAPGGRIGVACRAACPSMDQSWLARLPRLRKRRRWWLGGVQCVGHTIPRDRGRQIDSSRVAPASRPRRKGRRSASERSSTRTMCGVSVRTMSDSWASLRLLANSRPINGRSLRPGRPGHHRALLVADQTGEHVGFAVLQPDRRRDLPIAEGRQAIQRARHVAQRHLQRQRHLVVVMRPRRDVDVHADRFVDERGDRLLVDAAGGDRREGRHRHGHALAEARLRGDRPRTFATADWQASGSTCRT